MTGIIGSTQDEAADGVSANYAPRLSIDLFKDIKSISGELNLF